MNERILAPTFAVSPDRTHREAIRVEGVSKTFRLLGNRRKVALQDITLSFSAGAFTCIVGPSGCGKSTLLFLLGGLLQPDRGSISVHGSRIATVFQAPRLLPWRTVQDNVLFALRGIERHEAMSRTNQVLDLVGLTHEVDRFPGQLSGGMQQRVSIARALATRPDVLLMDEPFSALDEMTARRLRIELLSIWDKLRTTVVFVTHNGLEASYLADRVVVMQPSCVSMEVEIPLARPRIYEDPHLFDVYRQLVAALGEQPDRMESAKPKEDPSVDPNG